MTKRLDPEIKALRAINRALSPLDEDQTHRTLSWVLARYLELAARRLQQQSLFAEPQQPTHMPIFDRDPPLPVGQHFGDDFTEVTVA